jgi:hypothetical protein
MLRSQTRQHLKKRVKQMVSEKEPIICCGGSNNSKSIVRVSSWENEPLVEVDMSSGERLEVQWPCRIDFISLSGGISNG